MSVIFVIFRYLQRWELEAALDVLTMCNCHLPDGDPLKPEVLDAFISYIDTCEFFLSVDAISNLTFCS